MQSFEIQTFNNGRWKMDSVYDDRQLAIDEAKRVDVGGRYSGVRVIEENYDEATDKVTSRTLFRGGSAKGQKGLESAPRNKARQPGPRRGSSREPGRADRGKPQGKKTNMLVPALVLLVIVLGGVVALLGLQQVSAMK